MKGLDEQPAPPPPPQPGGLAGGSNLDQLMPVLLFIGFYNLVDIKAAVVQPGGSITLFEANDRRSLERGTPRHVDEEQDDD